MKIKQKLVKLSLIMIFMEICDKCGKTINLREKVVLDGKDEGIYHSECADDILGIDTN